jgi:hypothetical protein
MAEQRVTIKVGLTGTAGTRREADSTGKAVKGIGTAAEKTARKTRLAELSMHGLEKSSHRLRHGLRELAGITGLAGLAFGTEEMVKSAITAEAAQAKLTATLKSSGISYRKHGKEIDEALDKQAQFAGFTKGAVSDSLGNFIRTTGNVGKSLKLNNIAFDLAHTKGIGLANAQSILARAYNGNYKGLTRLGIAITPITVEQDKLRQSGKKATYQQIQKAKADDKAATATQALGIIQRKFSGQTAAYGRTAAGSVDRARISLEIAQEQIGKVLLPYVAKAAQKVAGLAQAFVKDWPKISATIKTDAGKVKAALSPLLSFVGQHRKGVLQLAGGFAAIALSLRAIKKVGHLTGLSKAASGIAHSPLGKILGAAAKADGTIRRPFYVVVLDKAPGGGKLINAAKKVAAPVAGAVARFGVADALGLSASALLAGGGIAYLAATHNLNLKTRGKGASSPSNPAGHVGFDQGAPFRRVVTPVNPAAVRTTQAQPSAAGGAITAGGFGNPFAPIHTHVYIDGKEIAHAVTRAAKKKLALK